MLTSGVLIVACLVAALILFALLPVRRSRWGGVLLGLCGLVYSFIAYPDRIALIVLPLSAGLFLLASAALVPWRRSAHATGLREKTGVPEHRD